MFEEKDNSKEEDRGTHAESSTSSEENKTKTEDQKNSSNGIKEILKFVIIAALIVAPIRTFVAEPFIVSGSSMFPTFKNGQYLIIDEISYRFHEPKRGDVIVFKYPKDPGKFFIKRIIGLPEETVVIENGEVIIKNDKHPEGQKLREEYVQNTSSGDFVAELKSNQYFVMGDNRIASSDSRYWGPLSKDLIVGRSLVRLFPFQDIGFKPGDTSNLFENATSSST